MRFISRKKKTEEKKQEYEIIWGKGAPLLQRKEGEVGAVPIKDGWEKVCFDPQSVKEDDGENLAKKLLGGGEKGERETQGYQRKVRGEKKAPKPERRTERLATANSHYLLPLKR